MKNTGQRNLDVINQFQAVLIQTVRVSFLQQFKSQKFLSQRINVFLTAFFANADSHNKHNNFCPFHPIDDPVTLTDSPNRTITRITGVLLADTLCNLKLFVE